jgi:hypothetical protein
MYDDIAATKYWQKILYGGTDWTFIDEPETKFEDLALLAFPCADRKPDDKAPQSFMTKTIIPPKKIKIVKTIYAPKYDAEFALDTYTDDTQKHRTILEKRFSLNGYIYGSLFDLCQGKCEIEVSAL